ncbi:MAG: FRG domain-containing protein [Spirochaetaceae bacterium]|nr:FRG domain-containing protein [Spirochaetaceae bacterium]
MNIPGEQLDLRTIDSVSTLQSNIDKIKDFERSTVDKSLLYYRGLSKVSFDLEPSVMRCRHHRKHEGDMLRELIARKPDAFFEITSALDRWMLAQHHGLYTRFMDVSSNPLVGLFFASGGYHDELGCDGVLYVFSTTHDHVKPYDSDAVSIISNFARLRGREQKDILKETKRFLSKRCVFVDRDRRIMCRRRHNDIEEVRAYYEHLDLLRQENEASGRYSVMGRLLTFIRQEKLYFEENLINPRDFFRIFIVRPRLLFDRVRVQSGAFLVSAYHKTFDFESDAEYKRNIRYTMDKYDVPYNYYRMTVKSGEKRSILEELQSLDISRENLFPGLSESARAILQDYRVRTIPD